MAKFSISYGETIQIGRILHSSFLRDQSDFEALSAYYIDPFGDNFLQSIEEFKNSPSVQLLKAETKVVTKRYHENMVAFRSDLNRIVATINLTSDTLTIAKEDFGVSEVRKAIARYKVPEFTSSMNNLMHNISYNIKPLTASGLTDLFLKDLKIRTRKISEDYVLQHDMISRRGQLAEDNMIKLLALQNIMRIVMDSGKAIYKTTNPTRAKDYTLSEFRRKHRAGKMVQEAVKKDENE